MSKQLIHVSRQIIRINVGLLILPVIFFQVLSLVLGLVGLAIVVPVPVRRVESHHVGLHRRPLGFLVGLPSQGSFFPTLPVFPAVLGVGVVVIQLLTHALVLAELVDDLEVFPCIFGLVLKRPVL